ncbi:MAG: hypothetical protein ACOX8R_07885 [Bacillota bacterium]|jgi:hypothetical protein
MRVFNYAVIKYFTKVKEACPAEVYEALKGEFGSHKMCKPDKVKAAIMTAEKNGLLAETRYELNDNGEVDIYYNCEGEALEAVNRYLGNYPD